MVEDHLLRERWKFPREAQGPRGRGFLLRVCPLCWPGCLGCVPDHGVHHHAEHPDCHHVGFALFKTKWQVLQGTPLTERFGGELIASIGTARPTTRWVNRSLRKYLSGQNILILKDLFKLYSSEELVCFQTVFFGRPILLKLSSFKGLVRFQFVLL